MVRDESGGTCLESASQSGNVEIVRQLLEAGAQIDATDERRYTPLMMAASEGHDEVVQVLAAAKASLDLKQRSGMTALMMATMKQHTTTVRTLLKAGARADVRGPGPADTAPNIARVQGFIEIERLLTKPCCSHCNEPGAAAVCAGCKAAHYCDRQCQKAAWKAGHKLQCGAERAEPQSSPQPPPAKLKGKSAKHKK
jgi:hypothetical protein